MKAELESTNEKFSRRVKTLEGEKAILEHQKESLEVNGQHTERRIYEATVRC